MEITVVTKGKTLDETTTNLKEAVALCLENEDLSEFGLAPNPTLLGNDGIRTCSECRLKKRL